MEKQSDRNEDADSHTHEDFLMWHHSEGQTIKLEKCIGFVTK